MDEFEQATDAAWFSASSPMFINTPQSIIDEWLPVAWDRVSWAKSCRLANWKLAVLYQLSIILIDLGYPVAEAGDQPTMGSALVSTVRKHQVFDTSTEFETKDLRTGKNGAGAFDFESKLAKLKKCCIGGGFVTNNSGSRGGGRAGESYVSRGIS